MYVIQRERDRQRDRERKPVNATERALRHFRAIVTQRFKDKSMRNPRQPTQLVRVLGKPYLFIDKQLKIIMRKIWFNVNL